MTKFTYPVKLKGSPGSQHNNLGIDWPSQDGPNETITFLKKPKKKPKSVFKRIKKLGEKSETTFFEIFNPFLKIRTFKIYSTWIDGLSSVVGFINNILLATTVLNVLLNTPQLVRKSILLLKRSFLYISNHTHTHQYPQSHPDGESVGVTEWVDEPFYHTFWNS